MSPYSSVNMTLGKGFKAVEGTIHMHRRGGKTLYNVKCSINKQQLKSAEKKWKKLEGE